MSLFEKFHGNEVGRDFVVGDIHGCFAKLVDELALRHFDTEKDRLFSVGDLVDRGPQSELAMEWLAKPWFHAVRGNHEQMAIDYVRGQCDYHMYSANGGGWFLALAADEQKAIAEAFDAMPIVIQVGSVGFVHAEPCGRDWHAFVAQIEAGNEQVIINSLWARTRIRHRDDMAVIGIENIYCGHTPVDHPQTLGNVHFIDTGAVFGGRLTVEEIK